MSYIPLSQYPFRTKAVKLTTFYLRRRAVVITAIAISLLLLFLLLKNSLEYLDYAGHDSDIDLQAYISFHLAALGPARPPLKPVHDLPKSCLDDYFALGELCHGLETPPLDVLWTWVNGSDPLLQRAQTLAQSQYAADDPYRPTKSLTQARLYRDHDELRHSMRSVLQNFRNHTARFRLLTADFPVPPEAHNGSNASHPERRLGQIPQWLDVDGQNMSGWLDGAVELSATHHGQIFSPYNGTNFNSLAIESQFSRLENLSENLYLNMHTATGPLLTQTAEFGIVLHLQADLLVPPHTPIGKKVQGEWRSMGLSNSLLSDRFGARHRPYVVHEAKTGSRALLHEMALTWPHAFADTATHAFRETQAGQGDVNTMFMLAHFVVERAREALLWSWVVGRVGGTDDVWGVEEAARAWAEVGGVWGEEGVFVQSEWRDTLQADRIERGWRESGLGEPSRTSYVFSSLDGYPYTTLGVTGQKRWPSLSLDTRDGELPRCKLSYAECFVVQDFEGDPSRASEVFKNLAFRKPRCGDCVILALVKASGHLGLSAFLPSAARSLPSLAGTVPGPSHDTPHLPVIGDWEDGVFSLEDVIGNVDLSVREWTLQLLQRYRFVIGSTPSLFERISSPRQTSIVLTRIERNTDAAMVCINDDVARANDQVTVLFKMWQDRIWSQPAAWERR
ncbi:hypothetical protein B0H21DRAFT_780951 [Amylocystis lapponica]|nr:hypothetical protein B0H21DRAFT_780951 [Amylocystis lapponica]